MSGSVGVNAFRSSYQILAQHCSKPCSRLPLLTSPSRRYISSLLQHQPFQCSQNSSNPNPNPNPSPVSRRCRRPLYQPYSSSGLRTLKILNPIIVHYVDLPPNYEDEEGLDFLRRELDTREVISIFGPGMSTLGANKLLRILHGRRVAGTLDDPAVQINTVGYSKKEQKIALDYLRKNVPVDEIVNAGLRAEDELAALEGQEVEEIEPPVKPSLIPDVYKKVEKKAPGEAKPSVYGEGVFDAIRARNKAKMEEELRRKEEEKRKQEEELAKLTPGELAKIEAQHTRQVSPRMQKYIEAATSDLKEPPQMKAWERLLPSALVVLIATGLIAAWAEFYRPPKRGDRLWPDMPPAAATIVGLFGLNLLVFCLWKAPPMWGFLNRYFLIVPATPRPISLFCAMFSHQTMAAHFLPNMLALWFFGTAFHDDVGRGDFLATYLGTGLLSALASMSVYVIRNQLNVSMMGASGALYGVAAAYFWLHRFEDFKIFGLPPDPMGGVPGMAFLGLAVGINIVGLTRLSVHRIDVVAHLTGALFGIIAAHFIEKKKEAKKLLAEQRRAEAAGLRPAPAPAPVLAEKVVEKTA